MARSRIGEDQVLDVEFLSEAEYVENVTTISGYLFDQILATSGTLQYQIDNITVSGGGTSYNFSTVNFNVSGSDVNTVQDISINSSPTFNKIITPSGIIIGETSFYDDELLRVNGGALIDGDLNVGGNLIATYVNVTSLTDGYIPYHYSDSIGFQNSNIYTDGTNVAIGGTDLTSTFAVTETDSIAAVIISNSNAGTYNFGVWSSVSGSATSTTAIRGNNIATGASNYGVSGNTTGAGTTNYGIYGSATGATTNWAGYFSSGNVYMAGNVGIGTTSPQEKMHVYGTGTTRLEIEDGGTSAAALRLTNTEGSYQFYIDAGNLYLYDLTAATQRVTLNSSGNVGIGTTSPGANLEIYGSSELLKLNSSSSSGSPYISFNQAGTRRAWIQSNDSNDVLTLASEYGAISFKAASTAGTDSDTEYMRIIAGGNVGIGTTGPSYKLQVVESAGNIAIKGTNTQGGTYNYGLYGEVSGAGTNSVGVVGYSNSTGTSNYGVYGIATGAGTTNYGIWASATSATTNWAGYFSGNVYCTANVSALSFTDRTPWYEGDALSEISTISGIDGEIDHTSLPDFVLITASGENGIEYFRDLGNMVSMLTVSVQQLLKRIEALEK